MEIVYITGFAGSGKSTTLAEMIKRYKNPLIMTPTHKAKSVLDKKLINLGLKSKAELRTIHSFLRAIPSLNEEARNIDKLEKLMLSKSVKIATRLAPELITKDAIFFDEAGMIPKFLFNVAIEVFRLIGLKIPIYIFLDPYQLTPVKGEQITIPTNRIDLENNRSSETINRIINAEHNTRFNLVKQYRSNQEITSYYTKAIAQIQKIMGEKPILDLSIPTNNILKPPKELVISREVAIEMFNLKEDVYLAYTNLEVASFLEDIKRRDKLDNILDSNLPLQLGQTHIIELDKSKNMKTFIKALESPLYNQRGAIEPQYHDYTLNIIRESKHLDLVYARAEHPAFGEIEGYFITVQGYYKYHKTCKQLDKYLITKNTTGWGKGDEKKKFLSQKYYPFKNAYPLDFAFALTVHKAQGSEYGKVFINYEDLKTLYSINKEQFFRLLYVASSRAINELYFIK